MKKKLPIGIQTFEKIRDPRHNYVYIDKTGIALELIENGTYYFLSRPRRFGKSLFLDTLSEIFKGSKHLFEGLEIYDKWDWADTSPVIRISFAVGDFSSLDGINFRIKSILDENCNNLGIPQPAADMVQAGDYFKKVIRTVSEKYYAKVVILIDEYDKPILDNIHLEDKTPASDARSVLREFYSAIKDSDEFIRFVFITGVSKFSKLNLFSGLNNLNDITISKKYSTIAGYTHSDLEKSFRGHFDGVNMDEVKSWYNGYNYFGEPVYNPFDILLFLENGCEFSNYWWETGNPSFLIETLKKNPRHIPELENIEIPEEVLNAFDVERIDIAALLWQTGYLTFDSLRHISGRKLYKLKTPNIEVQNSLNSLFLDYLTIKNPKNLKSQITAAEAILSADFNAMELSFRKLFSSIAHQNYINNPVAEYEGYYASVMFTFLSSLGFHAVAEDATNLGRIDLALKADNGVFLFEFKVDAKEEAALMQIKEKKYYEKHLGNKPVYLIGMHFCSTERNISAFDWEVLPAHE
jgi:hypothetical protein